MWIFFIIWILVKVYYYRFFPKPRDNRPFFFVDHETSIWLLGLALDLVVIIFLAQIFLPLGVLPLLVNRLVARTFFIQAALELKQTGYFTEREAYEHTLRITRDRSLR